MNPIEHAKVISQEEYYDENIKIARQVEAMENYTNELEFLSNLGEDTAFGFKDFNKQLTRINQLKEALEILK